MVIDIETFTFDQMFAGIILSWAGKRGVFLATGTIKILLSPSIYSQKYSKDARSFFHHNSILYMNNPDVTFIAECEVNGILKCYLIETDFMCPCIGCRVMF